MTTSSAPAGAPAIGVDVGGTRVKLGAVAPDGSIAEPLSLPTPHDPVELADAVGAQVALLRSRAHLDARTPVGVVVPGILDERRERVELAVNLGWRDVPVGALLRERLECPLAIGHDVRAGALAEAAWGAGRRFPQHAATSGAVPLADLVFVPIGTGIAAALVQGGAVRGDRFTGEIGQIRVQDPLTGEERRLEEVASAAAIGRRHRELVRPGSSVSPAPAAPSSAEPAASSSADPAVAAEDRPTARAVVDLAREGDAAAARVLTSALETLAPALATIIASAGTLPIVIGGGLAEGGSVVLDPLARAVAHRLGVLPAPPVLPSALGMWAGCQGAALLAMGRAS